MLLRTAHFRVPLFAALLTCGVAGAVAAADAPLKPPPGWTHVENAPSTDPQRSFDTWKQSSSAASQTLTLIHDGASSYADSVARVRQNFADNHIKATVDDDRQCRGKSGHIFEFASGPDGHHFIVQRTIVPDGAGIVSVTYVRQESQPALDEVKAAIGSFCGSG
jgi:hypothetical protein